MGEREYLYILLYDSNSLVGPLSPTGVCVTLRVLTQMRATPFNVLDNEQGKFVTGHFYVKDGSSRWAYEPPPEACIDPGG